MNRRKDPSPAHRIIWRGCLRLADAVQIHERHLHLGGDRAGPHSGA